jgi:hypothetical protein
MNDDDENTTHTIIPALPGWYVALYIPEDNSPKDDSLHLCPIVAWDIERTEGGIDRWARPLKTRVNATPITLEGSMEDWVNDQAIKTPDGKYALVGDTDYDTEAELIAELRRARDLLVALKKKQGVNVG